MKVFGPFADKNNMKVRSLIIMLFLLPSAALADSNRQMGHANRAYQQGDIPKAQAILNDLLVRDPGYADAYYLMGNVKRQQGDEDGAKNAYGQYLRQSRSPDPEILLQLRRNGFY